ncbi:AI-2E family transporter [Oceanicola sp. 22II-s10i]|uniref:AI-2E family transporter n=1 Tax=Oceanicola sp. 22II-s10i TaxID=1317116 RepID=UPI0020CE2B77|nr:AI-2E family transporter [Oceanicola sp. 22II-s10i]
MTAEAETRESRRLRRIQYMLAGILILLFLWSISLAKVVIMPIVLGLLIALTLTPFVRGLRRLGVPEVVSAFALIGALALSIAMALYFLSGPATTLVDEVPRIRFELREKMAEFEARFRAVQQASEEMENITNGDNENQQQVVVSDKSGVLGTALSSLAGLGSAVAIAMVLAMFLLAAGDFYHRKLVEALPRLSDKKRALLIAHDIERQISRYLAAITVINACLGLAVGITLYLLDMPFAYLWGVAAFLMNYLPFIGAMLGVAGCAAVSLVTFDTVSAALVPPLAYLTLTSLEGQIITPYLVGRHLKLSAAVVFVAVVFWAWLWGVAGALMAVPFVVFVKVICDHIPSLHVFGTFLGGKGDPLAVTGPATGAGGR